MPFTFQVLGLNRSCLLLYEQEFPMFGGIAKRIPENRSESLFAVSSSRREPPHLLDPLDPVHIYSAKGTQIPKHACEFSGPKGHHCMVSGLDHENDQLTAENEGHEWT